MMINKTFDLKKIKASSQHSIPLVSLFIIYASGVLLSLFFLQQEYFGSLSTFLIVPAIEKDIYMWCLILFMINLFCLFLHFYHGFNLVGKMFVYLLMLLTGFTFASIVYFFMLSNVEKAFDFSVFVLMPALILFSVAQLCAASQSISFSGELYDHFFKQQSIQTEIRTYLKRYILIFGLIIAGLCYIAAVGLLFISIVD